jgi:XrtN system VIT domain protein
METTKKSVVSDKVNLIGILSIIISTAIFLLPEISWLNFRMNSYFGLFFINYSISISYGVVLIINGILNRKKDIEKYKEDKEKFKNRSEHIALFHVLLLISAFSLNREFSVFQQSVEWLAAYIVILCITMCLLVYRNWLNNKFLFFLYFILGAGLVLNIYYAIYLAPMYMIGFVGLFVLGISIHTFAPIFIVISIIQFFIKGHKENRKNISPFIAGVILPIVIAIIFLIRWHDVKEKMNYVFNSDIIKETPYPLWVGVSQEMLQNSFMEKMLKTDLVYTTPSEDDSWGWNMSRTSFEEVKKHDPLIMIATLLFGKPNIDDADKIKILESMHNSRHKAQDRLWRGDKLETSNVISNIKIFPEYRIAYTEKILSVHYKEEKDRWNPQQEAVYTFHLPEGGVVTSLSLWINGKEEKGILTTKSKADSAYQTIVGVEQRDPSLIHWQEGNTISVRVFPCTPNEDRRFKIGFTAPLRKEKESLVYENIYFDGPDGERATESVKLQFTQKPTGLTLPFECNELANSVFKSDKYYEPYWEVKFNAASLSNESFSFDNHHYTISNYLKQYESFEPETIYLDLNNSWTKEELTHLWSVVKNKNVYVFHDELIKVSDDNIGKLYDELTNLNFSLFPIYKVKTPETAIIISKNVQESPNLRDLKGSEFSEKLTTYLKEGKKIRLFNIGNTLSPYLKTLKELRVFLYDQGSVDELLNELNQKRFVKYQETDSAVVIDNAQIIIEEQEGIKTSKAPDHLLRLFSYNHIMKEVSANYFDEKYINDEMIKEAQKANVVSPVSSLIVLETKQDYERFDIKNEDNSLKNASMKGSGSVPEPHEWVLIIITALTALYLLYKSYLERKTIL